MIYNIARLLLVVMPATGYATCCGCCPSQQRMANDNIEEVLEIASHRMEVAAATAALELMELDESKLRNVSADIVTMNDGDIALPENRGKLQLLIAAEYSTGELIERLIELTRHEDKRIQLAAVHGLGALGQENRPAARNAIAEWMAKLATSDDEKDIGRQALAALEAD